ncbi:hypothetical protein BDV06DRAFT_222559 [Aspergillus oleicola]
MALLPSDAYALCLLLSHSLFESEDDEFVCGRADPNAPLSAALAAFTSTKMSTPLTLWLSRVFRTMTHELGHCVYYACLMQGSTSMQEDMRQPPFLCPVDLAKLLSSMRVTIEERYKALLEYCEREEIRDEPHFAAQAAWLKASLGVCDSEG